MEGGGGGGRGLRERCFTTSDDSILQKEGTGTFITFRGRICEMSRLGEQEEKEEEVVVVVVVVAQGALLPPPPPAFLVVEDFSPDSSSTR